MVSELIKGQRLETLRFASLSSVPGKMRTLAIEEGEMLLAEPMDELPLSLYRAFARTGSRAVYETPYFRKRRRLSHLVIAELLEGNGRFMDRIEDEIWSLISEPSWAIPAHNVYIRDTQQLPVPDLSRPVLDLFAMESAEIMALSYSLLGDRLDQSLKASMLYEVRRRIIDPYLSSWFWWMGKEGKEKLNNWTVWCSQNVLLTVLAMPFADDIRTRVAEKAAASIDDWYMQYSDDGCCDEGAQYWHAAPLCFFGCIEILNEATGGALSSLSSDMKLRAMASYITNVHVADDRYLNFADCSPCAGWLGAREYLFGSFAGCSELVDLAVSDFREQYSKAVAEGRAVRLYDNDYNLWYNYLEYSLADEMLECRLSSSKPLPSFTRYDSVGLYIYRRDGVVLAVKGGGNDDSHNHNDTGSLILYDGSHPILADIGVETYTKTTFSKDRYTLFPMQSLYHNVVNFAGVGQKAGAQFRAKDVEADERGVSMELGGAYPEGTVSSYQRSVSFCGRSITVADVVKGASRPVLSLITLDRPEAACDAISADGWRIEFKGCSGIAVEEIAIADARLRIAWPERLYRTLVSFSDNLEWRIML